jgi:hypothetical protein
MLHTYIHDRLPVHNIGNVDACLPAPHSGDSGHSYMPDFMS